MLKTGGFEKTAGFFMPEICIQHSLLVRMGDLYAY